MGVRCGHSADDKVFNGKLVDGDGFSDIPPSLWSSSYFHLISKASAESQLRQHRAQFSQYQDPQCAPTDSMGQADIPTPDEKNESKVWKLNPLWSRKSGISIAFNISI